MACSITLLNVLIRQHRYSDPFNQVELDVVISDALGILGAYLAIGLASKSGACALPHQGRGCIPVDQNAPTLLTPICTARRARWKSSHIEATTHSIGMALAREPRPAATWNISMARPFFGLGDTWWMSLCKRLSWPDEFQSAGRRSRGQRL